MTTFRNLAESCPPLDSLADAHSGERYKELLLLEIDICRVEQEALLHLVGQR